MHLTGKLTGHRAGYWKVRHLGALALVAALVYAFWLWRGEWSPMHRWNRALGDAAFVMIALVMAMGPLSRLWRPVARALVWRRELGIWAVLAGLVHGGIILFGWVDLEWQRLFGFQFHPALERYVMVDKGFGLGNLIAMLALLYGLALALTSNDFSQRRMGLSIWKFLQQGAYVFWALLVAHTAYFMFMHFLDYHRQVPEPNPARWPFVVLVVLVMAVQLGATLRTWRHQARRLGGAEGAGEVG